MIANKETICSHLLLMQFKVKNMMKLQLGIESVGIIPSRLGFLCWTEIRLQAPFLSAAAAGKVSELSLEQLPHFLPHPNQEEGASWVRRATPSFKYPIPTSRKFCLWIYRAGEHNFSATLLKDTSRGRSPADLIQVRIKEGLCLEKGMQRFKGGFVFKATVQDSSLCHLQPFKICPVSLFC